MSVEPKQILPSSNPNVLSTTRWNQRLINPLIAFSNTVALVAISTAFFFTGGGSILTFGLGGSGTTAGTISSICWIRDFFSRPKISPANNNQPSTNHQTFKPLIALATSAALTAMSGIFFFQGGSLLAMVMGGSGLGVGTCSSGFWLSHLIHKVAKCFKKEQIDDDILTVASKDLLPENRRVDDSSSEINTDHTNSSLPLFYNKNRHFSLDQII